MHLVPCLQYSGHLIMNVYACMFHELPLPTLYHQILFISNLNFHDDIYTCKYTRVCTRMRARTHTHTHIFTSKSFPPLLPDQLLQNQAQMLPPCGSFSDSFKQGGQSLLLVCLCGQISDLVAMMCLQSHFLH